MTIDEIAAWPPRPQGLDMTAVEPELAAELADAREAVATLEARVVDLEDENFMLRDDRARLGASYEAERRRAEQLGAELEELRARHEALHMELLNEIEQLRLNAERQDRQYVLKVTGLQEALDMARVRQRRTLTAGLLAFALVAAIGGPIAYSFATHASAMATSPEDVAGHTTVVAPVDVPPPARHDAPVRPVEPAAAVRPAPVERHVAPARPVVHHVPVAKPVVHGPAAKPVTAGAWPVKPRGVHAPVARPLGAHPAHPAHPAADPIPAFIRAKF